MDGLSPAGYIGPVVQSLAQALRAYRIIAESEGKSRRTLEWVEASAGSLQDFLGDGVALENITTQDLRRWILALRQRRRWPGRPEFKAAGSLSATSINNYVRGVKLLLATLAREGLIGPHPAAHGDDGEVYLPLYRPPPQ